MYIKSLKFIFYYFALYLCLSTGVSYAQNISGANKKKIETATQNFSLLVNLFDKRQMQFNQKPIIRTLKDHGYVITNDHDKKISVLENKKFTEAFNSYHNFKLSKNFIEVSLEDKKSNLYDMWEYQILWRLGFAGVQTESIEIFNNNDSVFIEKKGIKAVNLIEIFKVKEGEQNLLKAKLTSIDRQAIIYQELDDWRWKEIEKKLVKIDQNAKKPTSLNCLDYHGNILFGKFINDKIDKNSFNIEIRRHKNLYVMKFNNINKGLDENQSNKSNRDNSYYYLESININHKSLSKEQDGFIDKKFTASMLKKSKLKIKLTKSELRQLLNSSGISISVILPSGMKLEHYISM